MVNYTQNPERAIELAYLACRNIDPWNPKYEISTENRIMAMWHLGHFSPFEFADATFYISGISRTCSHQLVRHRLASYEQLSYRSVDPTELRMIIPPTIQDDDKALFDIRTADCFDTYQRMGVPKEDARFIIPMGIETRIMVKMNFRNWLHFLRLRTNEHAQWEIRGVANAIYDELRNIAPNIFNEQYQGLWNQI